MVSVRVQMKETSVLQVRWTKERKGLVGKVEIEESIESGKGEIRGE